LALLLEKKFAPFFWTQFLGAFTDNTFKQALILMITFRVTLSEAETGTVIAVASGLFILPYFLFSPLAGQLSDKFEKAAIMRRVKLLEIVIMILAAIGFAMAQAGVTWAETYLIAILFLMGTQSTFFGPAKYSIIPQHLREDELMEGTALVESGTFVAILTGTIIGGILIMHSEGLVAVCLIVLAVAGWLSSLMIPTAPPSNPNLKIRWNWLSEYKNLYRVSNQKTSVLLAIVGISWFWFVGAMVMAQLPNFVKLFVHGDESVYIFFLSLFTMSIAAGSVLTNLLSDDSIELGMVPFGAIGLTVFPLDIGLLDYSQLSGSTLTIESLLTQPADPLVYRIIFDILGMGVAGSFFIVPLYALLQHRTAEETRSQVIAANNVAGAIFMVASAIVVSALYTAGLDTAELFLVLAGLNVATGLYLFVAHPEFVLRLGAWLLRLFRYRIRRTGSSSIPRDGPCLLYANRSDWRVWPLITSVCGRPVRFVHQTPKVPRILERMFSNWFDAIPIEVRGMEGDAALDENAAREIELALTSGQVVCLLEDAGGVGNHHSRNRGPLATLLASILTRTEVSAVMLSLPSPDSGVALESSTVGERRFLRRTFEISIGEP
jgi:MFS family permease